MRTPISAPWACPQCGRTVPAREPRCHCGVLRVEAPTALRGDAEASPSSSSVGRVVLAIVLVAAVGFGLYAAARQREQSLQAAQAAENERIRLGTSPPPGGETVRPAEKAFAPSPYTLGGATSSSPFPGALPSARAEVPPATKSRPAPADDASPSPTAMEEAWARASELLEPSLQKISAETSELQQQYAPFAQSCLASPDGNWLVAMKVGRLVPSGLPFIKYGVVMDCDHARRELVGRGNALKAQLDVAERLAQSSRVIPGHWRQLVEMHQLDVWNQY